MTKAGLKTLTPALADVEQVDEEFFARLPALGSQLLCQPEGSRAQKSAKKTVSHAEKFAKLCLERQPPGRDPLLASGKQLLGDQASGP